METLMNDAASTVTVQGDETASYLPSLLGTNSTKEEFRCFFCFSVKSARMKLGGSVLYS